MQLCEIVISIFASSVFFVFSFAYNKDKRNKEEFNMYPFMLKPMYDQTVWGRNRIPEIRGDKERGIGASWEVSAHPYGSNIILNGELKGMNLQEAIDAHEKEILGKAAKHDLLRCAISDAKEGLSIQNHPTDEYALVHDNDLGKTESWYVIDAMPGATLIAGTNAKSKEEVLKAIENKDIVYKMKYHPVRPGDFIQIESGELHALGGGITILEIANNSNVTYRLYDYERTDADGNPRQLHLKKGMDILNLEAASEVIHHPIDQRYEKEVLVSTPRYTVELMDIEKEKTLHNEDCFSVLHVVRGSGSLLFEGEEMELKYLQSLLVPAACKEITIKGDMRIIRAYPNIKKGE